MTMTDASVGVNGMRQSERGGADLNAAKIRDARIFAGDLCDQLTGAPSLRARRNDSSAAMLLEFLPE